MAAVSYACQDGLSKWPISTNGVVSQVSGIAHGPGMFKGGPQVGPGEDTFPSITVTTGPNSITGQTSIFGSTLINESFTVGEAQGAGFDALFNSAATVRGQLIVSLEDGVTPGGGILCRGPLTCDLGNFSLGDGVVPRSATIHGSITADGTNGTITASQGIFAGAGGISATAGGISATTGNIAALNGNITASGSITVTAGPITATAGGITATTGNISALAGNVIAAGSVVAGATVSAAGPTVAAPSGSGIVVLGEGNANAVPITAALTTTANTVQFPDSIRIFVGNRACRIPLIPDA